MAESLGVSRRVLHVIVPQREGAIGGADLHVLDLARQQALNGSYPMVLAPRASNQYLRLLAEAGVRVVTVPMHRAVRMARLPKELGVDIVHAHGYDSNYLVAALRALFPTWRRLPTVMTAHGWIETTLNLKVKSHLDRLAARMADVRVASAQAHASRLWAGAGTNIVVRNGVRPPRASHVGERDHFPSRPATASGTAPKVIGYVGRLSHEKRVDLLLHACARVLAAGHIVRLLIVGGGDERAALEELCTRLGLVEHVSFVGLVDDPEPQYAEMDLLVLPSITEGTPRTVIEAMARRIPVVATNVGDVAILLGHGEAGILVPPADVTALSDAIQTLLSDHMLSASFAERAEARFREFFTIEAMTRQVENCYDIASQARASNREKEETVDDSSERTTGPVSGPASR